MAQIREELFFTKSVSVRAHKQVVVRVDSLQRWNFAGLQHFQELFIKRLDFFFTDRDNGVLRLRCSSYRRLLGGESVAAHREAALDDSGVAPINCPTASPGVDRGMSPRTQPRLRNRSLGLPRSLRGCNIHLSLHEFEEIGIDLVCVRGGHTMRKPGIGFERSVLHELYRFRAAGLKRT